MKKSFLIVGILAFVTICLSIFLYLLLNIELEETLIRDGMMVTVTNYTPILIHSCCTLIVIVCFFLMKKRITSVVDRFCPPDNERSNPCANKGNFFSKWHLEFCEKKSWLINSMVLLTIFLLAMIQTHTLWDYQGEVADENALVYFAVGFFGGDFDPHWYGYGAIGMYILYAVYMVLSLPLLLFGQFANLELHLLH